MTTENQNTSECKCTYLEQCDLVLNNKARMPNLIKRIKSYYCTNLSSQCARRWVIDTLGMKYLPPLLLPNQWEWAKEIICEYGEKEKTKDSNTPCDSIPKDEG